MTQLYEKYKNEVMPQLLESLNCGNAMEVPRLAKVTLNMGVGEAVLDRKAIDSALADMTSAIKVTQIIAPETIIPKTLVSIIIILSLKILEFLYM